MKSAVAVFFCALAAAAAAGPTVRLATDAALRLDTDDSRFAFVVYDSSSGSYLETLNEHAASVAADLSLEYRFVRHSKPIGTGRVTLRAEKKGGGAAFANDVTAHADFRGEGAGYLWTLAARTFVGAEWKSDDGHGFLAKESAHTRIGGGITRAFSVKTKAGGGWTVTFPKPHRYVVNDLRRRGLEDFEVRFVGPDAFSLRLGAGQSFRCVVAHSGGKASLQARGFDGIAAGEKWIPLDWTKDVKSASALDFSRGAHRRPTVGADGPLVVKDGALRFKRRKREDVRLFGPTVQYDAAFAPKKSAQELCKRLVRLGYNSVRIAHADRRLLGDDVSAAAADKDAAVALDTFVSVAENEGLNVFRAFGDERSTHTWDQLGERRPNGGAENPSARVANALFLLNPKAFSVWQESVRKALGRKGTKSVRTCLEDPGQPLVSPATHGGLFSVWNEIRTLPTVAAAYRAWLEKRRKKDPDFMAGKVCEPLDLPVTTLWMPRGESLRAFLAEAEAEGTRRQGEFLRDLKSKALVVSDPGSSDFKEVAALRASGADVTATDFVLDPPRQLGEKGKCPWRIDNVNPFARSEPVPAKLGWLADPKRPFALAGWEHPPPSEWRAGMGLYLGALAAKGGWDAVWRGSYASDPNVLLNGKGQALDSQFANDPLALACERAVFALFARGDFPAEAPAEALRVKDGELTVVSPRTAGGFSPKPDGVISAGPVTAKLAGAPAAVWASSLSERPLAQTGRILVFHLTDMKRAGTFYADSRHTLLMKRGEGPVVVRAGTAEVSIAVDGPGGCRVSALRSDGSFLRRVPASVKDGKLCFTASVAGQKGAAYMYEVVKP